jgi:hypothetical protein
MAMLVKLVKSVGERGSGAGRGAILLRATGLRAKPALRQRFVGTETTGGGSVGSTRPRHAPAELVTASQSHGVLWSGTRTIPGEIPETRVSRRTRALPTGGGRGAEGRVSLGSTGLASCGERGAGVEVAAGAVRGRAHLALGTASGMLAAAQPSACQARAGPGTSDGAPPWSARETRGVAGGARGGATRGFRKVDVPGWG